MISDNVLMIKVGQGDVDKIGLLYERYSRILFGYFYKLTGLPETSEDMVNDVFLKMVRYSKKYRGDGKFTAWMFKIAHSVFADNHKKVRKMIFTQEFEEWNKVLANHNEPAYIIEKEEREQLLHKAMLQLTKKEREILILSKLDGFKYKEIAEILNCSEGAVKIKIFRALQNLKVIYFKMQN